LIYNDHIICVLIILMQKAIPHITKYSKFDTDDLWISKIKKSKDNSNFRNVKIYIDPEKLTRVRVKTPFFYIPFGISTIKEFGKTQYKLTASLFPLIEIRKEFKTMIDEIDDEIEDRIDNMLDSEEYVLRRSITKRNDEYNILLHFPYSKDKELFKIVDCNNESATISDVDKKMKGWAVIELSDVWIDDNKKKYGYSWLISQLKIYADIPIDGTIFIDDIEDKSTIEMKKTQKKQCKLKCPNCEHKIELNININMPISGGGGNVYHSVPSYDIPAPPPLEEVGTSGPSIKPYVPNLDELLEMKSKLKKTKTEKKGKKLKK